MVCGILLKKVQIHAPVLHMLVGCCGCASRTGGLSGDRRRRLMRLVMADMRIRTREEECLAPIVGPTYEVGRRSMAAHIDDLAVLHMTAELGGGHHDPIAHCCFHRCSLSCGRVELDRRVSAGSTAAS
jgi:hypothetical protein